MAERTFPFQLVAAALVFAFLLVRKARASGTPVDVRRAVWFNAALGVLAIALIGPIDSGSERALSWHMAQHLLIVSVAAPLLALGRPVELVLPSVLRRSAAAPLWSRRPWTMIAVTFISLSTLFAWHIPSLYDAALGNHAVHIVEHLSLLATSTLLWASLIGTPRVGTSVVWLFVTTLPITAFGVAMTIARTPWYADYVTDGRAAAVHDQQLAGVIMWAFGGLSALGGAVALFASWLVHASEPEPATPVPAREPVASC